MSRDSDRTREGWQEFKTALAKAIISVDRKNEKFRYFCDKEGWDDIVCTWVDDGIKNLGVALATLERWYEEGEENE